MPETFKVKTVEERESGVVTETRPAPGGGQPHPEVASAPALPSVSSVAVVGNGPSAAGRGAEIDACGFVVRCNWWQEAFPKGEAGTKVDAVCIWPKAWTDRPDHRWFDGELWMSTPRGGARVPTWHRAVRWIPEHRYYRLHEALVLLHRARTESTACWPSTGLVALYMAMMLKAPRLLLVGFDATRIDAPGWGEFSKVNPWLDVQGHDFCAEKLLIAELLREYNGDVTWQKM